MIQQELPLTYETIVAKAPHFTTATVSGCSQEQIQEKITAYIREYPPEGYGTHIVVDAHELFPSYWQASIQRYNSCD